MIHKNSILILITLHWIDIFHPRWPCWWSLGQRGSSWTPPAPNATGSAMHNWRALPRKLLEIGDRCYRETPGFTVIYHEIHLDSPEICPTCDEHCNARNLPSHIVAHDISEQRSDCHACKDLYRLQPVASWSIPQNLQKNVYTSTSINFQEHIVHCTLADPLISTTWIFRFLAIFCKSARLRAQQSVKASDTWLGPKMGEIPWPFSWLKTYWTWFDKFG